MRKTLLITLLLLWSMTQADAQSYYVYVAAESEDEVAVVRFDGDMAEVADRIPVGTWPTEIEGPHGLTVSPDGAHWFVTIAHGNPYGKLVKYTTGTNEIVGSVELGLFPATLQISPATGLLYAVNFNLHGDHEPSTVSVVDPESMFKITDIETGVMPHGSRVAVDGMHHYSLAMMSDELYEIDAATFERTRTLNLAGRHTLEEHRMHMAAGEDHAGHHQEGEAMEHEEGQAHQMQHDGDMYAMHHAPVKKPTWVTPTPDGESLLVACNGSDEVVEVNLESWSIARTFKTGRGPYNVEVTPGGKQMVVTYKSEGGTGIWDLASGEEVARISNTRKVPHGIAISPDGRYAFVTVEGIGGEPGTVDIIDLTTNRKVAEADVGKQAGGIAFWKLEP